MEPLPPNSDEFPWPTEPGRTLTISLEDFCSWCQVSRNRSIGNIKILGVRWFESRSAPFYHQFTVLAVSSSTPRENLRFHFIRIDRLGILNSKTAKETVTLSYAETLHFSDQELAEELNAKVLISLSLKPDATTAPTLRDVAECTSVINFFSPKYKLQTTNCYFQARSVTIFLAMKWPDSWDVITPATWNPRTSFCSPTIAAIFIRPLLVRH